MTVDPEIVRQYINGTAGDGTSDRLNHEAWDRWSILPRVLRNVTDVDATTELFGVSLDVPILVAPWQNHALAYPDGELATARGALEAGVGLSLSMGSSRLIEDVAAISGPYIQQIYVPQDRDQLKPFVERCVNAGACAFAVTVDTPPTSITTGFRAQVAELHRQNSPNFDDATLGSTLDLTAADLAWLQEFSGRPVLAKGVLRADDARLVCDAGAAGVIVSNHGGRQIDGSVPTAVVLPEIAEAVGTRGTLLVDGGVRRGADVIRALSLGASAVLVGRPAARALMAGGAMEVTRVMSELADDFRREMILCGVRSVRELTPDLVRWRDWG